MAEKVDQMDPDEKIVEIAIERLRVFENHPFRVEMDSQMKDLQDSIKQYGIITPVIVRPRKEGYYEIISGHRRIFAAEKLGYRKVPTIIRYMTDDQAVIAMVDSNLQRERIQDDFFNILHEESFAIAGIAVDINPITEDKMGSLAKYLESAEQYLKEKTQERKLEKPSVREKIKQAKQITQEKKKVNTEKSKNAER